MNAEDRHGRRSAGSNSGPVLASVAISMEVIAMIGPLVYDLAKLHVSEMLAEREMDRLAAEAPREPRIRKLRFDFRRLLPPLSHSHGSAASGA